jgi:hypothetical protein
MKKIIVLATFVITLMLPSTSFAEWQRVAVYSSHITFVDFDRVRMQDGYVYYWAMDNFSTRTEGFLSAATFSQGDCNLLRVKKMQGIFYTGSMGQGQANTYNPRVVKWDFAPPKSAIEHILNLVCSEAKRRQ